MRKKAAVIVLASIISISAFAVPKTFANSETMLASVEWVNSKMNPLSKKVTELETKVKDLEAQVAELKKQVNQ